MDYFALEEVEAAVGLLGTGQVAVGVGQEAGLAHFTPSLLAGKTLVVVAIYLTAQLVVALFALGVCKFLTFMEPPG